MNQNSRPNFDKIRRDAGFLGATLKKLARKIKDAPESVPHWQFDEYEGYYSEEPKTMAATLKAIARCLDIIAATPNAYINDEVLAEFGSRTKEARRVAEEPWAVELLGRFI